MKITLSQPKIIESENLKVGDCVKLWLTDKNSLSENKERLWVEVVEINLSSPKKFKGKVDSYPHLLEAVKFGDAISFDLENILDVIKN